MAKLNESPAKRFTSAQLSGRWNIPSRTIRDILQKAGVDSSGGYDVNEAADAVIAHLHQILESYDVEAAKDRARKTKAEAETAEFILAEKRRDVEKIVDVKLADFFVTIRTGIQTFRGSMSDQDKIALSKHLVETMRDAEK